jgi:hypothetical protein
MVQNRVRRYGYQGILNEVIYVKMRKETDQLKALEQKNRHLKLPLTNKTLAYGALGRLLEVSGQL